MFLNNIAKTNKVLNIKLKHFKIIKIVFLSIPVLFNLSVILKLIWGFEIYGDDNSYHLAVCRYNEQLLKNGFNPLDSFIPYWNCGFPINQYYNPLARIIVPLVHLVLFYLPLYIIFNLFIVILYSTFPLIIYYSAKKMNMNPVGSICSALVSTLILGEQSFGIEYSSTFYSGLFTQLFGVYSLPLAIAFSYKSLFKDFKKCYLLPVLLLSLTLLFHSIVGFIAIISIILIVFIDFSPQLNKRYQLPNYVLQTKKILKIVIIIMLSFLITGFFFIPAIIHSNANGEEPFAPLYMQDSFGTIPVLKKLFTGKMFDNGRLPVYSLLLLLGIISCILRKNRVIKFLLLGFFVFLLLYFGRNSPVGKIINLLPLSSFLPMFRFVIGVHFFSIFIVGYALQRIIFFNLPFRTGQRLRRCFIILPLIAIIYLYTSNKKSMFCETFINYRKELNYRNILLDIVKKLKTLPVARLYISDTFCDGSHFTYGLLPMYSDKPVLYGYTVAAGLNSLPFYYSQYLALDNASELNLFNVRYLLSFNDRRPPLLFNKIYSNKIYSLYEFNTSGYFDVCYSDIAIIGNKKSVRKTILNFWSHSSLLQQKRFITIFDEKADYSKSISFKNRIYVNNNGDIIELIWNNCKIPVDQLNHLLLNTTNPVPVIQIIEEKIDYNKYSAKVSVDTDAIILLKVSYHPYFKCFVDENKTEIIQLSPGFIGAKINQGIHNVTFIYKPGMEKYILYLISIATILFLIIIPHFSHR
ncbi:MAG: hypothetical protein AB1765_01995 [Candidatus Hydrogenedentota bacterium]